MFLGHTSFAPTNPTAPLLLLSYNRLAFTIMTTNPIILQLCERLRTNDPKLSSLSLSSLPVFEIAATEIDSLLAALLENHLVTDLSLSLPDGIESGSALSLLKQYLGHSHCPLKSLTLSSVAMSSWQGLCDALKFNTSVKKLEIGTAASIMVTEDPDLLNQRACQQFADALAGSEIECLTLRRFHIESSGWPCFVKALKATKRLELHQIVSDTNVFESLVEVCANLKELSIIECSSKTNIDTLPWSAPVHPSLLHLQKLRIAQCKPEEFTTALSQLGSTETLTRLDLRDNIMDDHTASTLADWLKQQSSLEKVIFEGCNLSDTAFSSIIGALSRHQGLGQLNMRRNRLKGDSSITVDLPPKLKVLELSENPGLGDSSWLPNLVENNPHVVEWKLDRINMTDKGLGDLCTAIDRHGETSNIRVLDLQQTSVDTKGLEALSFLVEKKLPSLTKINLASSKLGDDAISTFARAMKNHKSLIEVSVSHNPFGSATCCVLAEAVTSMPSLRSLNISFGQFDTEGLKHFVRALKENPRLDKLDYWTYASFRGETDKVEDQLALWLRLNQAGRRVTKEAVESNLFPIVLERARRLGGQQGLYFILRESVHLFEAN